MEQKIQLRVSVTFAKTNNPFDRQIKYVDSDSLVLRRADETSEFIKMLYDSVLKSFEKEKNTLRGSNLVFDGIELKLVQFIKLKIKRGGSYIPTPNWTAVKKATINPQNTEDNCCFAYSMTASIHHEEIRKDAHRITKLADYVDKYYWSNINFPAEQKDWSKF